MILVTGATGFLGSELCSQLLANGLEVVAVKRTTSRIPPSLANSEKIIWKDCDLLNGDEVHSVLMGATGVYHCAASVSFHPDQDEEMMIFNIKGTENVVNACLKEKIRLVHVSSVAVFDDPPSSEQLTTEHDFPEDQPKTHPYGLSKYLSERVVWDGVSKGLDAVVVNPSIILGHVPEYAGSGAFFKVVKDGLKFYTSGGAGFVAVEDVARCMIGLMGSGICGERFIISAENIDYKTFFGWIAIAMGLKPPSINASAWMLAVGWRMVKVMSWFTRKTPSFTEATANSSLNISKYDNSKIRAALNYKFVKIADTVRETAGKYN